MQHFTSTDNTKSATLEVVIMPASRDDSLQRVDTAYIATVSGIVFLSLFVLMAILFIFAWFVHQKEVAERRKYYTFC